MNHRLVLGILAGLGLGLASLGAQGPEIRDQLTVQGFYSFDNNQGWGQKGGFIPPSYSPVVKDTASLTPPDQGRDLGNGWGGVGLEAVWRRSLTWPVLRGEGVLFTTNKLDVNLSAGLSPVSLKAEVEAVLTPLAIFQVGAGAMVGTGWDVVLFNGLGINDNPTGVIDKTPFGGLVSRLWAFGALQFDLGAVIPGEWSHVLLFSRLGVVFQYFTRAKANQAWQWAGDEGLNFNAAKLATTHFLGYQMPLPLQLVGALFETESYLPPVSTWSPLAEGGWGSDFLSLKMSLVTQWALGETTSLAVLLGVANFVDYTDGTIFNRFYAHRSAETVGWKLDRLSFAWTLRL